MLNYFEVGILFLGHFTYAICLIQEFLALDEALWHLFSQLFLKYYKRRRWKKSECLAIFTEADTKAQED